MQLTQTAMHDTIAWFLAQAKLREVDSVDVAINQGNGLSVTVRQGEPETIEHHADQSVNVTVYRKGAKGAASTTDLTEAAMLSTLDSACNIARYTVPDAYAGIADQADLATEWPALDLYYPWDITVPDAVEVCRDCEARALALDKRLKQSDGASLAAYQGVRGFGNSHGFIGAVSGSRHHISVGLVAEANGQMQHDYSHTTARDPSQLWPVQAIADEAVARTVAKLNPRKLTTRKAPVMFAPDVAVGLISHLFNAISGSKLYQRASFLLDSIDQSVLPDWVNIYEDPFVQKGLASTPFDMEGCQVSAKSVINKGVVERYFLSSYSARKLGMRTTGNAGGLHNILVSHQNVTFDAMLKKMETGLLVTDVIGQGVNLVTGDYSRGVSGFWVENGEIQYPVEEITIAGNLNEMYRNVVAIGNDIDVRHHVHIGSVLLEEMTIAGI